MEKGADHGVYVDVIVNGTISTQAFADLGCLCFALVSEQFVSKKGIDTEGIEPRQLRQVSNEGKMPEVSKIAMLTVDIDGYPMAIAAYVVPKQEDNIILGLGWMRHWDVELRPARNEMTIHQPVSRTIITKTIQCDKSLKQVTAAAVKAWCGRGKKDKTIEVFSVSMRGIQKALQGQQHTDPRECAPEWLKPVVYAFNRQDANALPPHREGLDHAIELEEGRMPPAMPLYPMSKESLLVLRKTLTDLLDKGFIQASSSPAGAPILFVKKAGGGLRFCVDYRGLNSITRRDKYPLPLIHETLRMIASAKWISKVDVIQAFHRVRVKAGDEWKTTFNSRLGAYHWLVTPFGLSGAPATFQRYINHVLQEELDISCSAYLDDVVIFSNGSRSEHRELVRKIIGKLADAGLQLDFDKSEFEAQETRYLGFIVKAGLGIEVDPEKTKALLEWNSPTSVKGVRSFLGFANFYREFVKDFATIASPLTMLTQKQVAFEWKESQQKAFDKLKSALVTAPLLVAWDPEASTIVEADSSGYAIGAALLQQQKDGLWRPVAYHSRKLDSTQCNWPIYDKEMWAILSAVRDWQAELMPVDFKVHSDHKNLAYFRQVQRLNERQIRWANELQQYNFTLVHKAGKGQILSDTLSRREQDMPQGWDDERLKAREQQLLQDTTDSELFVKALKGWIANADAEDDGVELTSQELSNHPQSPFQDNKLSELWKAGLQGNPRYWKMRQLVRTQGRNFPSTWGLAISISECDIDEGNRLLWRGKVWIPAYEPLRTAILQTVHDSPLSGHPGRDALRDLVKREYTWPSLSNDIRRFIRNCGVCGRTKFWREQKQGLLKPLPIAERVWQELSMDFITDLPLSKEGYENILVVTDRLTKAPVYIPMATTTAQEVASALLKNVFQHHLLPKAIVSDRGPQFVNKVWKTICDTLKIQMRMSTAFHPQTDGSTERENAELEAYLRAFCAYEQTDWVEWLPVAQMARMNHASTSTRISPFFFTHGYNGSVIETLESTAISDKTPAAEKASHLAAKLAESTRFAQVSLAVAQESQETQANKSRRAATDFQVGDGV